MTRPGAGPDKPLWSTCAYREQQRMGYFSSGHVLKKSSFMFQNNDSNHSLGPKKPDFSILMPLLGCIYA